MSYQKRALVTGGTGFIGTAVVQALKKRGFSITVLARHRPRRSEPGVKYASVNLLGSSALRTYLRRVTVVVHLAGNAQVNYSIEHPAAVIDRNMRMLLNVVEAARVQKEPPLIVFASTDRMYGRTKKKRVTEHEPPYPIEPYTASKIMGEIMLEAYSHLYGVPYVSLRFDGVYGPGQPPRMFLSDLIRKMIQSDIVAVGDLRVRKNFVYVDDAARAVVQAAIASDRARNTAYSIGGDAVSLGRIAGLGKDFFAERQGRRIRLVFDPALVRRSGAEVRPFILNKKKAQRLLGWKPMVSLERGVRNTIQSFLSYAP